MNSLFPYTYDELIFGIDEEVMEQEDVNEAGFLVDAGRSLLPNKQPCTSASSGTSDAMLFNAAHSGLSSYTVTSFGAMNSLENTVAAHSGLSGYVAAIFGAMNAPEKNVAAHSGMTSFVVASMDAMNAPQNTVAAPAQLLPFTPSSNIGIEVCHNLNTPDGDEGFFDLHDLFTDQMF